MHGERNAVLTVLYSVIPFHHLAYPTNTTTLLVPCNLPLVARRLSTSRLGIIDKLYIVYVEGAFPGTAPLCLRFVVDIIIVHIPGVYGIYMYNVI